MELYTMLLHARNSVGDDIIEGREGDSIIDC